MFTREAHRYLCTQHEGLRHESREHFMAWREFELARPPERWKPGDPWPEGWEPIDEGAER